MKYIVTIDNGYCEKLFKAIVTAESKEDAVEAMAEILTENEVEGCYADHWEICDLCEVDETVDSYVAEHGLTFCKKTGVYVKVASVRPLNNGSQSKANEAIDCILLSAEMSGCPHVCVFGSTITTDNEEAFSAIANGLRMLGLHEFVADEEKGPRSNRYTLEFESFDMEGEPIAEKELQVNCSYQRAAVNAIIEYIESNKLTLNMSVRDSMIVTGDAETFEALKKMFTEFGLSSYTTGSEPGEFYYIDFELLT